MTPKERRVAIEKREQEKGEVVEQESTTHDGGGPLTASTPGAGGAWTADTEESDVAAACIEHPMWEQWAHIDQEFTKRRQEAVNCCAIAASCLNWGIPEMP